MTNKVSVPARPSQAPQFSSADQNRLGQAWNQTPADLYHRTRPGYSTDIIKFFLRDRPDLLAQPGRALDIGAGTGLLTEPLLELGWQTTALDPSLEMLAVLEENYPNATTVNSTLEELDEYDIGEMQTFQLAVCGQAWHWIDPERAGQKLGKLLAPQSVLGIVQHQLDTSVPWVHRLSRIMHAGDVHPVKEPPKLGREFSALEGSIIRWEDSVSVDQIHDLMQTRSYYLRTHDQQRQKMHSNLDWYLTEHLGHSRDELIDLNYVTSVWRTIING